MQHIQFFQQIYIYDDAMNGPHTMSLGGHTNKLNTDSRILLNLNRFIPLYTKRHAYTYTRRNVRIFNAVNSSIRVPNLKTRNHKRAVRGSPLRAAADDSSTATPDDPELALILIACGVGVATGAGVVLFNDAIHVIRDFIWQGEALVSSRELLRGANELELWPKVVFPPVLGGVFVGVLGLLNKGYDDDKNTSSSGSTSNTSTDEENSDAERKNSQFRAISRPISRAIAAAVTLGSGASLGPEGPSVDIGRSCANGLGSMLKRRDMHISSLIAAGSGAGVAAGFNAPIAGVFFAVETVLQKQMLRAASSSSSSQTTASSGLTVAMVLLASVLAAVVSQAGLGSSPAFRVPEYRLESLYELPLYLVFGGLCGVVSASFSFSTRVAGDAFDELRGQQPVKAALLPSIGGLTTGVLALGYPEILYQGFDNVNNILSSAGTYPPSLLIQILVMKIIATSICRGSGLQGGIYAPSIFMGAALGTAFGEVVNAIGDPTGLLLSAPQAYALVGVAAMLASNCAVPLTSVLLLFELTRDYLIIVPTLGAVGIAFWISQLAAPGVKSAAARRRTAALAAAAVLTAREAVTSSADTNPMECDIGGATVAEVTTNLTLTCAIDRDCLLVQEDMLVVDALTMMDRENKDAVVVLGVEGGVLGLAKKEMLEQRLAEAMAYAEDAVVTDSEEPMVVDK